MEYKLNFYKKVKDDSTGNDTNKCKNEPLFSLDTTNGCAIKLDGKTVVGSAQIISLHYDKRLYEPCSIAVKIKVTNNTTDTDIATDLIGKGCDLISLYNTSAYVAKEYIVTEAKPQITGDNNYIYITIHSMDKLLDLVEECRAYTAKKLCTNILKDNLSRYHIDNNTVETNASESTLQFLSYTVGSNNYEFIQPYIVQYNETFYRMLARTANRCGEFMYYEDGKLNIGLKYSSSTVAKNNYAPLNVKYPTVNTKSIYSNKGFFSRDYTKATNSISAVDILKTLKNLKDVIDSINSNDFSQDEKDALQKIKDILADLDSKYKSYKEACQKLEERNRLEKLLSQEEEKKNGIKLQDDYKYTTKGITEHPQNLEQANEDYVKVKEEERNYRNENYWTPERDKRYNELQQKQKEGTLSVKEELELDDLKALKDKQDEVMEKLNQYKKDCEVLEEYIYYYQLDKRITELKSAIGAKITWNSTDYTDQDTLDNDWKTYYDQQIKDLKTSYEKIKNKLTEEQQNCFEQFFSMATDKKTPTSVIEVDDNLSTSDANGLPQSSLQFIYDYEVPTDGYFTDYTNGTYYDPEDLGFKADIHTLQGLYKFLSDGLPLLASVINVGLFFAFTAMDLAAKIQLANDMMDSDWKDTTPTSDNNEYQYSKTFYKADGTTERYTKDTHMLFATTDQTSSFIKNLKATGLAAIRKMEETLGERKISITLDTALSQDQLKLGDKILFDNEEYIVIAMQGSYDNANSSEPFSEKIEAIPIMNIEGTDYNVPPMIASGHVRKSEPQTAKVQNTMDPQDMGRVRIRFSWQTDSDNDSPFIRVAAPWAPSGGGAYFRPGKNEEVMIDFEHGNVERPYVSGSLFNASAHAPLGGDKVAPQTRIIQSANGHKVVLSDLSNWAFLTGALTHNPIFQDLTELKVPDTDGSSYAGNILLTDHLGFYKIEASADKRAITVDCPFGSVRMDAFTGITLSAPYGDVSFTGKNINIKARNNINVKAGLSIIQGTLTTDWAEFIGGTVTNLIKDNIDLSIIRHLMERFLEPIGGKIELNAARNVIIMSGLYSGQTWDRTYTLNSLASIVGNTDDSIWKDENSDSAARANVIYRMWNKINIDEPRAEGNIPQEEGNIPEEPVVERIVEGGDEVGNAQNVNNVERPEDPPGEDQDQQQERQNDFEL